MNNRVRKQKEALKRASPNLLKGSVEFEKKKRKHSTIYLHGNGTGDVVWYCMCINCLGTGYIDLPDK